MVIYDVMEKNMDMTLKNKEWSLCNKNHHGVGGTFSFDEFGEVQKPVMFKVVKNGQFVKLEE